MSPPLPSRSNSLADHVIAVTGDFGRTRPHSKIKFWIEYFGGKFATKVELGVTHLLCRLSDCKKGVPMVREAQELNKIAVQMRIPQMQIRIVYLDWLEAALVRENPQIVASYNHRMQRQLAKEREPKRKALEVAKKALIKKSMASYEKGRQDFVADFDTDGYHMFRDFTGFAYDITLSRPSPGDNQNELWILKMYESDSEPMKFASCAHHLGPGLSIKKEILAFNGSDYAQAFGEFEKKFREIMKRSFYDRLGSVDRNLTEFSYVRPGKGEPTGTLKPGETFATLIRY